MWAGAIPHAMAKKPDPKVQFRAWVKSFASITNAASALDCTEMTVRNVMAKGKPSGRIGAAIERETEKAGTPILAAAWWA